ncbi:MAG: AraC family transcriptional regulator ligand-binding domain-containing protein [Pseudomonadota bacterium]
MMSKTPPLPHSDVSNEHLTVSSAYLKSAYTACLARGCPADALDALIAGGPKSLDNPTARFPNNILNDVLFLAEELTGITGMGIHFGQNIRPSTLMDIGYALLSCDNLADMIAFNRKYQPLTQQLATGHLEIDGKTAHLIWTPADENAEYQRPITESAMAGYAFFGRWVTWDPELQIEEIHMRHAEPEDMSVYNQALPYKLTFEAEKNMVVAPTELFRRPLPQANPELVKILAERLDRALDALKQPLSVEQEAFACVQSMLRDGAPTIIRVAETLGSTERTLRRRLSDEGVTFRDVLEAARKDACDLYLKEGKRSVADLALLLGYSEQSAFTRAFKGWFGMPPSQYIKR